LKKTFWTHFVIFVDHKMAKSAGCCHYFYRRFMKGLNFLIVLVFQNVLNILRRSSCIVCYCRPYVWAHCKSLFWPKCFFRYLGTVSDLRL